MAKGAFTAEELKDLYVEDKFDEFKMACDEESPAGCHSLGQWFAVVAEKPVEAYREFKKNCLERGHGNSCLSAGLLHMKGAHKRDASEAEVEVGLWKSHQKALAFFSAACECDPPHPQGCATAASMLRLGQGCKEKDPKKAFDFDMAACKRGHPPSCYQVGGSYIAGNVPGIAKDPKLAFRYTKKACENNYGAACYNLAFMYKRGDGVEQNSEKAEFYWQMMLRLKKEREMFMRQDL